MIENPILTVNALSLWYGKTRALQEITLSIPEKKITAFIGPSGCGKSTLLRLLSGLALPSGGSVEVDDQFRGPGLAYVFQSPTLMPWASVEANVGLPLKLSGMPAAEARMASQVHAPLARSARTDA